MIKKIEKKRKDTKILSPVNFFFFEQSILALRYQADKHFKEGNFHDASVLYKKGYNTTTNYTSPDKEEQESIRQLNIIFRLNIIRTSTRIIQKEKNNTVKKAFILKHIVTCDNIIQQEPTAYLKTLARKNREELMQEMKALIQKHSTYISSLMNNIPQQRTT